MRRVGADGPGVVLDDLGVLGLEGWSRKELLIVVTAQTVQLDEQAGQIEVLVEQVAELTAAATW